MISMNRIRRYVPASIRTMLKRLALKRARLADLYYCVDYGFQREHQAVIAGKLNHIEQLETQGGAGVVYTLRRNIHRLEKGLIARPRRDVFARDYILETTRVFQSFVSDAELRQASVELSVWARNVLSEYFELVQTEDTPIGEARRLFEKSLKVADISASQTVPYRRDLTPLRISYDDLLALAWRRRSVRWYLSDPVPRAMIDKAVVVAGLSPSACNRQPFEFRFFDDPELCRKVASLPAGTGGFHHQFPCVAAIIGDLSAFPFERDRHLIYIDASLAAMAFQFALEVQGIASCSINWPEDSYRDMQMSNLLGLKPFQRTIMCMSLGWPDPDGMVPYSQKKGLDELRSYNRIK